MTYLQIAKRALGKAEHTGVSENAIPPQTSSDETRYEKNEKNEKSPPSLAEEPKTRAFRLADQVMDAWGINDPRLREYNRLTWWAQDLDDFRLEAEAQKVRMERKAKFSLGSFD